MKPQNQQLIDYLSSCSNQDIIFVPTPGKIGDALLALSAYRLMDKYNVRYTIGTYKNLYTNKQIIIGGGGNLIGHLYFELETFIENNFKFNQITILPHTIFNLNIS